MAPELEFRFTIGYLLLFVAFAWIRWSRSRYACFYAHLRLRPLAIGLRSVALVVVIVPLGMYIFDPATLGRIRIEEPDIVRFLAAAPAALGILWLIWACRTTEQAVEQGEHELVCSGPYSSMRHPQFGALSLILVALAFMTARIAPLLCALAGILVLRLLVVPLVDLQLRSRPGERYRQHVAATGCFFFPLTRSKAQYQVPRRFGLSAVLALVTTFAFVFGGLNFMNAPPAAYLFVASEITAICLGQIVFGSSPRGASAVAGGLLLPFWVVVTISRPPWVSIEIYAAVVASLLLIGAMLGYCLGALIAGFFLVIDLLEAYLPGAAVEVPAEASSLTTDNGAVRPAIDASHSEADHHGRAGARRASAMNRK